MTTTYHYTLLDGNKVIDCTELDELNYGLAHDVFIESGTYKRGYTVRRDDRCINET